MLNSLYRQERGPLGEIGRQVSIKTTAVALNALAIIKFGRIQMDTTDYC